MDAIRPEEVIAFDMYFATVVGMNNHPGYHRENTHKLTVEECAGLAVAMIVQRRQLIPSGVNENE